MAVSRKNAWLAMQFVTVISLGGLVFTTVQLFLIPAKSHSRITAQADVDFLALVLHVLLK